MELWLASPEVVVSEEEVACYFWCSQEGGQGRLPEKPNGDRGFDLVEELVSLQDVFIYKGRSNVFKVIS